MSESAAPWREQELAERAFLDEIIECVCLVRRYEKTGNDVEASRMRSLLDSKLDQLPIRIGKHFPSTR